MTFNEEQVAALKAPLSSSLVKTRKQGGREVSYIEGWKAVEEANRILASMAGRARQLKSSAFLKVRERSASAATQGMA